MRTDRHGRARGPRALVLAAVLLVVLAAGCGGETCVRHSDCDPGLACSPLGVCLVPAEPDGGDGGLDAADAGDAAADAGDAATDGRPGDGPGPVTDGGPDAALDAAVDAGVDGTPPTLESPYASPISPEVGLPHDLTP